MQVTLKNPNQLTELVRHLEVLVSSPSYCQKESDPFFLQKRKFSQKDLNLIVWSLSSLQVKSDVLVRSVDVKELDLKSLIIYAYSTFKLGY